MRDDEGDVKALWEAKDGVGRRVGCKRTGRNKDPERFDQLSIFALEGYIIDGNTLKIILEAVMTE